MANIAGPNILSVTREQGAFIRVQYQAGASGYTRMYYDVRTPTGAWRQATSETERKGWYVITSIAGAALDPKQAYQVKMRATHSSGNPVNESSAVNVPAWVTPPLTILSWDRVGVDSTRIAWEGLTSGGTIQFQFRSTSPTSGLWNNWFVATPGTPSGYTNAAAGIYPGTSYELRAVVNQYGVASAFSNVRSINAVTVTAPSLGSVTRTTPQSLTYDYSLPYVAGQTLTAQIRVTPSGGWSNKETFTPSSSGSRTITGLAPASGYEIRLLATQSGVSSGYSSSRTVNPWSTSAPNITSATRVSATSVEMGLSGGDSTSNYVVERRTLPSGSWSQVAAPSGTTTTLNVSAPDGALKYGYRAKTVTSGVSSEWSSERTVNAWYGLPQGVANLQAGRRTDGAMVQLTWSTQATAENPYDGQRVQRADGALGQFRTIATLGSGTSSYIDSTAKAEESYRYTVTPYNSVGDASSSPTASVAPSILAPDAPSNVTAAYLATDRVKLTWEVRTSPEKPVTSQTILRRNVGSSAWTSVGTASSVATTFTDTAGPNRLVEYAIRPVNSAGVAVATSPASSPVATTPATPGSVSASWQGTNSILVTWPSFSTIGDAIDVEFSTDNTTWYPGTTPSLPLPVSSRSWSQTQVSVQVPHWYRVRVRNVEIPGSPPSGWVLSNRVDQQTTPLAPTILPPESTDPAGPITLRMVHNPVDGTAQTLGQFRYRVQGAPSWTTATVGTSDTYTIPAGTFTAGSVLEVQGHTAGATAVYGPWSASLLATLRARPSVTILDPADGRYAAQDLTVTWQASSQTEALVEVLSGPQIIASKPVGADIRTVTFAGLMQDRAAYTVRATVRDLWQWSLPATVSITVELARPGRPGLDVTPQHDSGRVVLQASPNDTGLRFTRINYEPHGLREWYTQGQKGRVTLSDGTRTIEAWGVTGSQFLEAPGVGQTTFPDGWVYRAGVKAGHSLPGMTGRLAEFDNAYEKPLPVWPAPLVDMHIDFAGEPGDYTFEAYPAGGATSTEGSLYLADTYTMGAADYATLGAGSYFDGNTPDTATHYHGWLNEKTAYEATPAVDPADADIYPTPTVRMEVYRSTLDGPWVLVGSTDTGSLIDRLAPICAPVRYKARAYAANGAWAESAPTATTVNSRDLYLNYGPNLDQYVVGGSRDLDLTGGGRDTTLYQYADDTTNGTGRYTAHRDENTQPRTISATVELVTEEGASTINEWISALGTVDDVVYREPGGLILTGASQLGSANPISMEESTISFTVSET